MLYHAQVRGLRHVHARLRALERLEDVVYARLRDGAHGHDVGLYSRLE